MPSDKLLNAFLCSYIALIACTVFFLVIEIVKSVKGWM